MTPFVQQAQGLLVEIEQAPTQEARKIAEDKLAALIQLQFKGRTWTADNRMRQTGDREQ
jgi:hypothetical protein